MKTMVRVFGVAVAAMMLLAADGTRNTAIAKDCAFCQDMLGGGGWGHSFQSPGALFDAATSHPNWLADTCGVWHGPCGANEEGGTELDFDAAIVVLNSDDADQIERLLLEHPKHTSLVATRGAIHLLGCKGQIVGHFALSEHVLQSLTE